MDSSNMTKKEKIEFLRELVTMRNQMKNSREGKNVKKISERELDVRIKNRMIEVSTKLDYMDKGKSKNKSHFEINYASIIKIDEGIKDRKIIEKIILCDVQKEIYDNLEKIFINLLSISGYPGIKFGKKVDFEQLYNQRLN